MDRTAKQEQASVIVEDDAIVRSNDSDDESVTSSPRFGNDDLMMDRLEEGNRDYDILKKCFVGKGIDVVGIYKKNYDKSVMDAARKQTFDVYASAVARRNSGESNVEHGWYGASLDEICDILKHGFRPSANKAGPGLCLLPANSPMESIKTSVADSDGLRHVLLCCVILGNPETISYGSHKGYPSSPEFDSGVDNISNPTKYIIWEHHMNTYILPEFIVSFKGDPIEGEHTNTQGSQAVRKPTSQYMISELIEQLTNHLSSAKMASIKKLYLAYSEQKIFRPAFIRRLRAIAGDDVIWAVVRKRTMKRYVKEDDTAQADQATSAHHVNSFAKQPRMIKTSKFKLIQKPRSQNMNINDLIEQLKNHLSSSKMASIKKLHLAYSERKICRPAFIRRLKAIAGDDVIQAVYDEKVY